MKPVKKMKPHTCCQDGEHTYIVTKWTTSGGKQQAIELRCRHCLMPLDLEELNSAEWSKVQGI